MDEIIEFVCNWIFHVFFCLQLDQVWSAVVFKTSIFLAGLKANNALYVIITHTVQIQ